MFSISLFLFLFLLVSIYFIIEKRINDFCLSSFQAVIHVNGIRGKTSSCRHIDAALRSKYKVFTKTTGTDAMCIDVNGIETPVRRFGPANLHEQIRIIRRAKKEGAEILILECMAVRPDLQKAAQELIVKSTITVITNVRYDHVFEMGNTLEEIAESLSSTIPSNGTLYTADPYAATLYQEICREKNCELVLCPSTGTESENIGIAHAIATRFDVSEEDFERSMAKIQKDFGSRHLYTVKNKHNEEIRFISLFSANDPLSTKNNIEQFSSDHSHLYFLYNHREDRPDRALLFARYFFPHFKDCTVFLTGRGAALPKRLFSDAGVTDIRIVHSADIFSNLPSGSIVIGIGNIKGEAYHLIKQLEEQETYE